MIVALMLANLLSSCIASDQIQQFQQPAAREELAPSRFVLVLIDTATEKRLGEFPYSRAVYADAIRKVTKLGAKGVALKFFFDQERDVNADQELAKTIKDCGVPVVLQARISPDDSGGTELNERFFLPGALPKGVNVLGGAKGWLPIESFQTACAMVGFVDIKDPLRAPLVESFNERPVRSLTLALLETAYDSKATLKPDGKIHLGDRILRTDSSLSTPFEIPAGGALSWVSLSDVLDEKVAREKIDGRVVVIAYDGDKIPLIETPEGPVKAHRLFWYGLLSTEIALRAEQ